MPYYKDRPIYLLPELDSELKSVIGSKVIHAVFIFVSLILSCPQRSTIFN